MMVEIIFDITVRIFQDFRNIFTITNQYLNDITMIILKKIHKFKKKFDI